jgi:hypothetical protein
MEETPEPEESIPARKYQRQEEEIEETGDKPTENPDREAGEHRGSPSGHGEVEVEMVDGDATPRGGGDGGEETEDEDPGDPLNLFPDTEMVKMLYRTSEAMGEQVEITEMYSPPRITEEAKKWGIKTGEAMDLTTGWDFRRQGDRERAWQHIRRCKPQLIVGSPMCTMFSVMQNFTKWTEEKTRRWCEAKEHLEFMIKIYEEQEREGRWFLHEHPVQATSWDLEKMRTLLGTKGVMTSVAD